MRSPTLLETAVYNTTYWSYFWGMTLGWSLRTSGRPNLPMTGPVLLVANHQSHFDPPLVGITSRRRICYLARSTLFKNPVFGKLIAMHGAVPIERDVGTDGLKAVWRLLDDGQAVIMFPEGTRSDDGQMQPFKAGISLLVKKANCKIVPVGIAGCYAAWPRQRTLPTPSPVLVAPTARTTSIHYGEAYESSIYRTMNRDAILAHLESQVRASVEVAELKRRK